MPVMFGIDVPFEVFKKAMEELEACHLQCADEQHLCGSECADLFDSPGEQIAGIACTSGCFLEGLACTERCKLKFLLALGFQGVPEDHKNPDEFVVNVKDTFKGTRAALLAGAGFIAVSGGVMKEVGDFKKLARLKFAGGLMVVAGVAGIAMERYMKSVIDDPPDAAFTEIFVPRTFRFQDVAGPFGSDGGIDLLFRPFVSEALYTVSLMEGLAVSMDRASTALDAGDQDHHLAQFRASQVFSREAAQCFKRMRDSRLTLANKLAGLTLEDSREPIRRLTPAAVIRDFRLDAIRSDEKEILITHAEAKATQERWANDGIDAEIRQVTELIAGDSATAHSIIQDLLNAELHVEDFDTTPSLILQKPKLTEAENEIVQILEKWGHFYG